MAKNARSPTTKQPHLAYHKIFLVAATKKPPIKRYNPASNMPTPIASLSSLLRTYGGVFVRGLCMGAADLVPGVSGGTIAFISGIYERLIAALAAFAKPQIWRSLAKFNIATAWRYADGSFLCVLFAGILVAILILSDLLHHLLNTRPHLLLGFFFGLVIASTIIVYRQIDGLRPPHLVLATVAAVSTFGLVTTFNAVSGNDNTTALFFGGMVAIGAMLLPGISGSYILLILGLYPVVLNALHERNIALIAIFAAGCGCGLLAFARLLSLLLNRWKTPTMAVLIGIMLGALPKLWPWKADGDGAQIILQTNLSPADYADPPQIAFVIILAVGGALVVLSINRLTNQRC